MRVPILILCLALTSCAHTNKNVRMSDALHVESADEKASSSVYLSFLKSEEFALVGDFLKAKQEIEKVKEAYPDNGFIYYELALNEADQKNNEQAIAAVEKALELSPDLIQARLLLAKLYATVGKELLSIKVLENAIKDVPQEQETYSLLIREYISMKRFADAERTAKKLLVIDPDSNAATYYLAVIYGSFLKQYDRSISLYKKLLEADPLNSQIHAAIVQIYLDNRQSKKALEKLLEMETLEPGDLSVQLKVALVYYELRDFSKAASKFEKILEANPESDKIRYYLGAIYMESGNFDLAIKHFQLVPAKSNFYKDANLHVAQYYSSKKKDDEAVRVIEHAIKEKPTEPDLYFFLAAIFEKTGNSEKIVEVMKKAVEKIPDNESLFFTLGLAFEKAHEPEKAVTAMEKVVKLNPKNATALNYLGYTLVERGENLDEAETMLQDAASLRPNDGYIIDSLGWLYFKKGDLTKAYELLTQAAKLSPKESTVFEHLGDLHHLRGDLKQAQQAYKRSLKLLRDKKNADPDDIKRLEEKLCEAGGC